MAIAGTIGSAYFAVTAFSPIGFTGDGLVKVPIYSQNAFLVGLTLVPYAAAVALFWLDRRRDRIGL